MKIEITNGDIAYAEKVLLKDGETFDKERVDFIRCLETLDLQAVPGSGKTTALLAKLLILERHLPLENDAGILVLSHTNAAVDEIKEKIGRYCPQLFSYPHFIGTIQQFVNHFLAIPHFVICTGHREIRMDADAYDAKAVEYYRHLDDGVKNWLNRQYEPENLIKNLRFDGESNLTNGLNGKVVLTSSGGSRTYRILAGMKKEFLKYGILHFDDAYFLADRLVKKYPSVVELIRRRFPCVFVDEMQDMARHQHDLLETLFYSLDATAPVFQRIGDKNQAIFSYEIFTETVWTERSNELELKGSYRLSKPVAEVVKNFAESYQDIDARGSASHLPVIVAYDDATIEQVLPWFASKIKLLELDQIPKAIFHAVGWVKNPDKRLSVGHYWEHFEPRKDVGKKEHYERLADYIEAAKIGSSSNSFKAIEHLIMAAILEVLRLEGVRHPASQRYFTRTTLLAYLRDTQPEMYADLRLKLYQWCCSVIKDSVVVSDMEDFLKSLLELLGQNISNSRNFISAEASIAAPSEASKEINVDQDNGVKITFGTVHSVKGRTHTATLYLETFNGSDGARGNKGYDSGKLKEQFCGQQLNDMTSYIVKNARVAYVGMSRPTHLLCVAIHKNRLPQVDKTKWEIVDAATGEPLK